MAKHYDAAIKQLVEKHPADWLAFAGLPAATKLEIVDADLSVISPAADKVIRVDAPTSYVAHLEFQSSPDPEFDRRMLMYNALLRWRHRLPVRSVAVLLRPQTEGRGTTGAFTELGEADQRVDFRYRIIRLWKQSPNPLLQGGLGTLPLAPIADVSDEAVHEIIGRMQQRLNLQTTPGEEADTWAATLVLLGLKYSSSAGRELLRGVRRMQESTTYQAIIEEGQIKEAHALILRLGRKRFGPPPAAILQKLDQIADLSKLEALTEKIYDVAGWDQLLERA